MKSQATQKHLVWFRNDLRIRDNPALHAACEDSDATVTAVYVATPGQWKQHDMSPMQAGFIRQNLLSIQQALARLNIELLVHQCNDFSESISWLSAYCRAEGISAFFYNRQYEYNEAQRDAKLQALLSSEIDCHAFDDSVLLAPGTVLNKSGTPFRVFTPFSRAFIHELGKNLQLPLPAPSKRSHQQKVKAAPLPPFNYQLEESKHFLAGETAALERLDFFAMRILSRYASLRDLPAEDGTSRLSPYLAVGVLSPRQCLARLLIDHPDVLDNHGSAGFAWLNELVWRDFYRHMLAAWPALSRHRPFISWTDGIRWQYAPDAFLAWQTGQTGYPIVDAAMRQLNATGWMHNRLRMVTASFLVKDLLIDWREGERYFMSKLIDGDLAANNGGWQWSASTGADAVPYFRIFNPISQGRRFDPRGEFVKHWIPELRDVPAKHIHTPHAWASQHGIRLDYPVPIVEHAGARQRTIAAYQAAKRQMADAERESGKN